MSEVPHPPYGLLIWAKRVIEDLPHVMIFDHVLHNDELCRYGTHWDFQFSGQTLFLTACGRQVASVELTLGHAVRGGFFVALKGSRPTSYPVLITDALETQLGPIGIIHFTPSDIWLDSVGTDERGDPEAVEPNDHWVFSEGWFGAVQIESADTAHVITYSCGRLPTAGDRIYFTEDHELLGSLLSFDATLA